MGDVEKVFKSVANTYGFLRSVIITLQFWTPDAAISMYFTSKKASRGHGLIPRWESGGFPYYLPVLLFLTSSSS